MVGNISVRPSRSLLADLLYNVYLTFTQDKTGSLKQIQKEISVPFSTS